MKNYVITRTYVSTEEPGHEYDHYETNDVIKVYAKREKAIEFVENFKLDMYRCGVEIDSRDYEVDKNLISSNLYSGVKVIFIRRIEYSDVDTHITYKVYEVEVET